MINLVLTNVVRIHAFYPILAVQTRNVEQTSIVLRACVLTVGLEIPELCATNVSHKQKKLEMQFFYMRKFFS